MSKFTQLGRELICLICPLFSYTENHILSLSTNNTNKYIIMTSHYSPRGTFCRLWFHILLIWNILTYFLLVVKHALLALYWLLFIYLPYYSFTYVTIFHVSLTHINNFTVKLFKPIVPNPSCQNVQL